uniref:bidirectional sugar transporter SWEET1-like n=1 Tax=Fragaria vesca subsp. vesca TaxID=101020 RepID=UPI0005CB7D61|nr:PREDICTED: bidirectional sugar transporter SWEET1-like [Fragaria vesca subsp. vesca]
MNILKLIFRLVFGNVIATFFFWSPMSKFKQIITNNFADQLSSISYQIHFFKCLFSACKKKNRYWLPFVSPNSNLISTMNGIGAAIEAINLFIPMMFSPKSEKDKLLEVLEFVFFFKHDEKCKELSQHYTR